MRKIQQYYIFRFSTDRLKEKNYKIKSIDINQARKNTELITLSDSELVRQVFRVTKKENSKVKLDELLGLKKKYSNKKNSVDSRKKLKSILDEIDQQLFIPEIVSLKIIDKRHYQNILDRGGFEINGRTFVPLIFSAGLIRRNSGLFVDSIIKDSLMNIFDNGRDKSVPVVPAKINAYLGLYSSSTLEVRFPRIAVVPDLELKKTFDVDFGAFVGDGIDPVIETGERELDFNFFDGCGMVSPNFAKKWSQDLELDYVGSTFGVRSSWLKGMCVTMDFQKFGKEIAETFIIKDVYGKEIDIRNIDVVVSTSMFKMYNAYKSTNEYVKNCESNEIGWGISKVNPKNEKDYCKTSYQYLQVIKETKENQIEGLCQPTLDWLSFSSGGGISSTLLYSLGEMTDFGKGWFNRIEPLYQSLILENDLIHDDYLISHLDKSLGKKKRDSKKGNLFLNGNYQAAVPDMLLYCRYIFGMELIPTLKSSQAYSNYWNKKDVEEVVGIRSPLVFESEMIRLNFVNNSETEEWFKHIKSGIVLPANGVSLEFMLMSGADSDYDLIATINSKELLDMRVGGKPVTYELVKPPKQVIDGIDNSPLFKAQMDGLGSKVGFYTNVSSSYYCMLDNFDSGSEEYKTIYNRLKWLRCVQSLELDRQKGLITPDFPNWWTKYKKITDNIIEEEKEKQIFNNSILCDKRPRFFIYLYDNYMRRYKKEQAIFDNICYTRYNMSFEELLKYEKKTKEQKDIIERYKRKTYFIDNQSVMNKICRHMENEIKSIRTDKTKISKNFEFSILLSDNFKKPILRDVQKIQLLYKEYKSLRKGLRDGYSEYDNDGYSNVEQIYKYINQKAYSAINSNSEELSDMVIWCVYNVLGKQSKGFLWNCFGQEVVQNIKNKKKEKFVTIPIPKEGGKINYLWKQYSNYSINIEE